MRRGKPKIPRECIGKKIIVEEIKKREKVKRPRRSNINKKNSIENDGQTVLIK